MTSTPKMVAGTADGDPVALPLDREGWIRRWNWLDSWYTGGDYTQRDHTELSLFSVFDGNKNLLTATRRVVADAEFLVDTNADMLAGRRWNLSTVRSVQKAPEWISRGEAVWHRSRLQERREEWLRSTCMLGDRFLEATLEGDKTFIRSYDPRWVLPTTGANGELVKVEVTFPVSRDPLTGLQRWYRRTVDSERVIVDWVYETEDPNAEHEVRNDAALSGTHGLGVVPFVQLQCKPIANSTYALWAGHRIERTALVIDSFSAQLRASLHRFAAPHLVAHGVRLRTAGDVGSGLPAVDSFGMTFQGLPEGAKLGYLESNMAGAQSVLETIRYYSESIRSTIPEFTRSGVGANTSGAAIAYRADALRQMMESRATRIYGAVSRVTQFAVAMEDGSRYAADDELYRIQLPIFVPLSSVTTPTMLGNAVRDGVLKRSDAVRVMQTLGFVSEEEDPEEYAADISTEIAPPAVEELDTADKMSHTDDGELGFSTRPPALGDDDDSE